MKKILVIFMFLCVSISYGYEPTEEMTGFDISSKKEMKKESNKNYYLITSSTLLLVDMFQTLDIAENPDKHYETNPILGEHPSKEEVYLYFGSGLLLNYLAVKYLPDPWWKVQQVFQIGISLACITNNISLGIGFSF